MEDNDKAWTFSKLFTSSIRTLLTAGKSITMSIAMVWTVCLSQQVLTLSNDRSDQLPPSIVHWYPSLQFISISIRISISFQNHVSMGNWKLKYPLTSLYYCSPWFVQVFHRQPWLSTFTQTFTAALDYQSAPQLHYEHPAPFLFPQGHPQLARARWCYPEFCFSSKARARYRVRPGDAKFMVILALGIPIRARWPSGYGASFRFFLRSFRNGLHLLVGKTAWVRVPPLSTFFCFFGWWVSLLEMLELLFAGVLHWRTVFEKGRL